MVVMKEGANMTAEEWERLRQLDTIIAYNNPDDCGRDLTEEEAEEHRRLFWQAMQEYEAQKGKE